MTDLMLDEARIVDTAAREGDWERAEYDAAFALYRRHGHNADLVGWIMQHTAEAQTPDGEPIPPVPSVRTIQEWARRDGWRERSLRLSLDDGPIEEAELAASMQALRRGAILEQHRLLAGVYDDDPKLAAVKQKGVEVVAKMMGVGAFGANQGGTVKLMAHEVHVALGQGQEDQKVGAKEQSRRNRENIAAGKRGE